MESFPASVTVWELRDWFAVSACRRLALLADGDRYAGALVPSDINADEPADRPALELARDRLTLPPDMPAAEGRNLVLASEGRRLPVVDGGRRLHEPSRV